MVPARVNEEVYVNGFKEYVRSREKTPKNI